MSALSADRRGWSQRLHEVDTHGSLDDRSVRVRAETNTEQTVVSLDGHELDLVAALDGDNAFESLDDATASALAEDLAAVVTSHLSGTREDGL